MVSLCEIVGISCSSYLVINGAAAAEKHIFAELSGSDITEVSENLVCSVVRTLVCTGKLVDKVLILVAALFLHTD